MTAPQTTPGTLLDLFQKIELAENETEGLHGRALHRKLERLRSRVADLEKALCGEHTEAERTELLDRLYVIDKQRIGSLHLLELIESLENQ